MLRCVTVTGSSSSSSSTFIGIYSSGSTRKLLPQLMSWQWIFWGVSQAHGEDISSTISVGISVGITITVAITKSCLITAEQHNKLCLAWHLTGFEDLKTFEHSQRVAPRSTLHVPRTRLSLTFGIFKLRSPRRRHFEVEIKPKDALDTMSCGGLCALKHKA